MSVEVIARMAARDFNNLRGHIMRQAGAVPLGNPLTNRANDQGVADIASMSNADFSVGPIGTLLYGGVNSGEMATIVIRGQVQMAAGSAVAIGKLVTTNDSGRAIVAAANDIVVARAEESANSGEMFKAEAFPAYRMTGNN